MHPAADIIPAFLDAFGAQKDLADKAIAQVSDADLRRALDENTNSIAVIMKHVGGNLRSRFTDFLATDGEKPWRNRDDEFIDHFQNRIEIHTAWEDGWHTLYTTLSRLTAEHLAWSVNIRGEAYTVAEALARSLAHTSYHCGQIVLTARLLCKDRWTVITVPRGQSRQYNQRRGYIPTPSSDSDDDTTT
jgi:hypothetical protein